MSIARYTELVQLAREKLAAHDIKHALSLAVGITLSRKANLPGTKVESVTDYYITTVANEVCMQAARINERVIIDIDLACETARQFWVMRYHNAYPLEQIPFISDDTGHFFSRLTGCGHMVPQPEAEFLQANANGMILLINRLCHILDGTNEIIYGTGSPEPVLV